MKNMDILVPTHKLGELQPVNVRKPKLYSISVIQMLNGPFLFYRT